MSTLTTNEHELAGLVQDALRGAYPRFNLQVSTAHDFGEKLSILVTIAGQGWALTVREPVDGTTHTGAQLETLRDDVVRSVIEQLGDPQRAA